jgi:hypothetical protein
MKPITVYRIAHKLDFLQGPLGTQSNGMPLCMAWEMSDAMLLDIPEFKKGRFFAFTKEQLFETFILSEIKNMEKEGFVIYEVEVTEYEIHEDQVTFEYEGSFLMGNPKIA